MRWLLLSTITVALSGCFFPEALAPRATPRPVIPEGEDPERWASALEALDMAARGREWALRHLGHQARAQAWTSFLHQAVKA